MTQKNHWPSTHISLIHRIREPDNADAWTTFVDTYGPLMVSFCRKRGLQSADSEDAVQDAMMRVCSAIKSFEYDQSRGKFRGWLGTIVRRSIFKILEAKAKSPYGEGRGADMVAFDVAVNHRLWTDEFNAFVFRTAIDRVKELSSEKKWVAFKAVWIDDQSASDVARQMRMDEKWVYHTRYELTQRLRREITFLTDHYPALHMPPSKRKKSGSDSMQSSAQSQK